MFYQVPERIDPKRVELLSLSVLHCPCFEKRLGKLERLLYRTAPQPPRRSVELGFFGYRNTSGGLVNSTDDSTFRLLVEKSPDGHFILEDGEFTYLNSAALRMFGWDEDLSLIHI